MVKVDKEIRNEIKDLLRKSGLKATWDLVSFVEKIAREVGEETHAEYQKESKEKYLKGKEARDHAKQKQIEEGERFKQIVKPGMIVKCRGTRDRYGIREVLEVSALGITARKIECRWNGGNPTYKKDSYITTHGWDKVKEILDIKI